MKVLISGAGIAGLTLAFWLQRDGNAVTIVEKSPSLRDEGYMMDFFGSGYDVAAKMDVLHELANIHYPISRLTFLDVNGREKFSVAYTDFRRLFGGHHFNFMRGDLERVLYSKIKDRLQLRFATTVESFEQKAGKVHAKFSDGSGGLFDLLVGADGVHSRIRRLAFAQEKNFSRFLGYYTAAFILDRQPHSLGIRDAFYTLATPERQVGAYPTRSGRLATLFVYKAQRRVNDFSFETAVEELRKVYGRMDWIVPELLDRCDRSSLYFDEVSQIEMPR